MGVKKVIYGLNLVIGAKIGKRFHLYTEPYWGIGIMKRNIFNTHYIPPPSHYIDASTDLGPMFNELELASSSGIYFNFLIGVRLGYIF
jgi:hypothetical protein